MSDARDEDRGQRSEVGGEIGSPVQSIPAIDSIYRLPICKNDRCNQIVPVSKNPGRPAEYCSPICRRRFNARKSYERATGSRPEGLIRVLHGCPQVFRTIPPTMKLAQARFLAHLDDCPLTRGQMCPARFDVYDRKHLCLIHAVFNDDWGQVDAAEEGRSYQRKTTTLDGLWTEDREKLERAGIEVLNQSGITRARPEEIESKQMIDFLRAGGGDTEKSPFQERN